MKLILVLSALVAIAAAKDLLSIRMVDRATPPNTEVLTNGTFEVPLDHFNPTDGRRLKLAYTANVRFFKEGGPLFFYVSDTFSGNRFIRRGLAHSVAAQLGGALITADLRYFGRNRFANSTTENLKQLTFDQLLADLANLVVKVKDDLDTPHSHVVSWGSRFSGTIAAMGRKKYPHSINSVWASSGLFRSVAYDATFYNTVAWNLFWHGSLQCSERLSQAFDEVAQLVAARNQTRLQNLFNTCAPVDFSNPQDVTFFWEQLFNYVSSYFDFRHHHGIREFCSDLEQGENALQSFARWANYVFVRDECAQLSYANHVQELTNVASTDGRRETAYLQCIQYGLHRITTEDNFGEVFPDVISQEYHDQYCTDLFADAFNRTRLERAVDNFNIQHGAQNQIVPNAVFTYGELDPLLNLGIFEYDLYSSEVVATGPYSVSADLEEITARDSVDLVAAKRQISEILTRFAGPDPTDHPEPWAPEKPEEQPSKPEEQPSKPEEQPDAPNGGEYFF